MKNSASKTSVKTKIERKIEPETRVIRTAPGLDISLTVFGKIVISQASKNPKSLEITLERVPEKEGDDDKIETIKILTGKTPLVKKRLILRNRFVMDGRVWMIKKLR